MNPPTHPGNLFTWTGNKGVTEASTLGRYVDNGEGFYIKSHRTGKLVHFSRTGVERDAEGDLVKMTYRSTFEDGFEVEVFNT